MKIRRILTVERLHECLLYNPATGVFTWVKARGMQKVGAVAGTNSQGYIRISIDNVFHQAHRLAWLYVFGEWPHHEIDHINGNKADNRIANLRDVTTQINAQNKRKAQSHSSTRLLGVVCRDNGTFRARLKTADGRFKYFGTHKTPEAAHKAYIEGKRIYHAGNVL